MAIIVPIVMAASGASAAVAGALTVALGTTISTTLVTAVTSLAFQVAGVNSKINKAASKVFGEDLVNVVNIAGAVYGAVNGGFDFGGSGVENVATAGEVLSKATLDGTASFGANSAANAFDLADAASGLGEAASAAGDVVGKAALDGTNAFGSNSIADSFNLSEMAQAAPDAGNGVNLLDSSQELGTDTKALAESVKAAEDSTLTGASTQTASANDAASAKAATEQQLKVGDVTKGVQAPKVPPVKPPTTTKPGSFFEKMLSSDKAMGAVVQGVGGALSSAAQGKSRKEELEFQKRLKTSVPTVYTRVQ